jgi:ABC-type multidrug transport system ATPase subunit
VVWATQRVEELVGFADRATVLDRGTVRFAGTVAALAARGGGDRHVVRLGAATAAPVDRLDAALGTSGRLLPSSDASEALLALAPGVSLGTALAALMAAGAEITGSRDEHPPIERAFRVVTERAA